MIEMVKLATTDDEIMACFDVMSQLRTHLKRDEFLATIREMMAGGYQLAYIMDNDKVISNAGFRIAHSLYMGRHLYVDDLISDQKSRSHGHGHILMTWLTELAKSKDCKFVHLDSGVQRADAHRFYLNQGMRISCFHFEKEVV